jgi:hypothetical protein
MEMMDTDMDQPAIIDALHTAMSSAAVFDAYPPGVHPAWDVAAISRLTDIAIKDEAGFQKFVRALRAVPEVAAIENKHFITGINGQTSGPILVEELAKSMLAQVLNGRPAPEVVEAFSSFLKENRSKIRIVISISGVDVGEWVDLGGDVELLPVPALPPSIPRGIALGQPFLSSLGPSYSAKSTSALFTIDTLSPIIVSPGYFKDSTAISKFREQFTPSVSRLEEALNCITLNDLFPAVGEIIWSEFLHPGAFFIQPPGWSRFDLAVVVVSRTLIIKDVQKLCASYFSIPANDRRKVLHTPLSRLGRAIRQFSVVDRAIDLGIALEALLLHDAQSNTELGYRLRLRGALLREGDLSARRDTMKLLNELYKLRSNAVHRGRVDRTEKNWRTLEDGIMLCAELIRIVIERGGKIDFDMLELRGQ